MAFASDRSDPSPPASSACAPAGQSSQPTDCCVTTRRMSVNVMMPMGRSSASTTYSRCSRLATSFSSTCAVHPVSNSTLLMYTFGRRPVTQVSKHQSRFSAQAFSRWQAMLVPYT